MLEGRRYSAVVLGHSITRDEKMEFVGKRDSRVPVLCICVGSVDCCGANLEVLSPGPENLLCALESLIKRRRHSELTPTQQPEPAPSYGLRE